MGSMTIAPILDLYDTNPERVSKVLFPGQKIKSKQEVEQELRGLDYNEFSQFRDELGVEIEEAERTKAGRKVNKAYLTKNKAAMKKEIDRVAKLKNDDPSAYTKWDADYADKDKKKPYKTKKSAATSAYEKRFGESINEGHDGYINKAPGSTREEATKKLQSWIDDDEEGRFRLFRGVKWVGSITKDMLDSLANKYEDEYIVLGQVDGELTYAYWRRS